MEDRREARQPAEGGGEEENDSRRTEVWQGRQESVRTRGELRGDRKGGTGGERARGMDDGRDNNSVHERGAAQSG